jgi:hypothetical protein
VFGEGGVVGGREAANGYVGSLGGRAFSVPRESWSLVLFCSVQGSAARCSFYLPYLPTYRLIGESISTPNDPAW